MNTEVLGNLLKIATGIGICFAVYTCYFVVYAALGLKKHKKLPKTQATTRFGVLIAARNEEAVVGQLVGSLMAQNYPRDKFEVIVAPNNCTDNTEQIARTSGAKIFTPFGAIRTKGDVLHQAVKDILEHGCYDATCVIDADNLVHPDFLQRMNDAYNNGARAAQGYRDSKNPADSPVSTCYSVLYWMMNRLYNAGHHRARVSAQIQGSGFMAATSLLREIGGWNTTMLTEDYEFTAQCVLQGERVHYVADAVIFDGQPLSFAQSWKQRRRWSTGGVEGMWKYSGRLWRMAIKQRSMVALDMALTFARPLVQLVGLVVGTITLGLRLFTIPMPVLLVFGIAAVLLAYVGLCAAAALVVGLFSHTKRGTGRGVLFFAFFLLSWVPIMVISMFKHQKTWDAIPHTKAISLTEMA